MMSHIQKKKCVIVYYQFETYFISIPFTINSKYFESDIEEISKQLLEEEDIEYTISVLYKEYLVPERISQYNVFEISYDNFKKFLSLSFKNTFIILCSFENELTYDLCGEKEVLDHLPQIHVIHQGNLRNTYSKYKCSVSWSLATEYDIIAEDEDDAEDKCNMMDLSDFNACYVEDSFTIEVR